MEQFMRHDFTVSEIALAIYVLPGSGESHHRMRPTHGIVLTTAAPKEYLFSDGTSVTMHTDSILYLPKNSDYDVRADMPGGCYAINFDAVLEDAPFSVPFRNAESLLHNFKVACDAWKSKNDQAIFLLCARCMTESFKCKRSKKGSTYLRRRYP